MLTCIARSKRAGDESTGQPDDPDSKHAKSLTSQVQLTLSLSLSATSALSNSDRGHFRQFIHSSRTWLWKLQVLTGIARRARRPSLRGNRSRTIRRRRRRSPIPNPINGLRRCTEDQTAPSPPRRRRRRCISSSLGYGEKRWRRG